MAPKPGLKCAYRLCHRIGEYREGSSYYCLRCRRNRQMRTSAKYKSGQHISRETIDKLFDEIESFGFACPVCQKQMVIGCDIKRAGNVVTLQHWEDGSLGLICLSCNCGDGSLKRFKLNRTPKPTSIQTWLPYTSTIQF